MSMLAKLLGSKKPATSAAIADLISQHEANRLREEDRAAKARAALASPGLLDDAAHVEAEATAAEADRAVRRIDDRLTHLRTAHADALKVEARAALKARAEAARKLVANGPRLLAEYEEHAARLAETAAKLAEINASVFRANAAIATARKADRDAEHPDLVACVAERFLSEPDEVKPDVTVAAEIWEEPTQDGRWTRSAVFNESGRPQNVAARKRAVERVIPGKTRKGRSLPCPTAGLNIPAARIGAKPFWPAG